MFCLSLCMHDCCAITWDLGNHAVGHFAQLISAILDRNEIFKSLNSSCSYPGSVAIFNIRIHSTRRLLNCKILQISNITHNAEFSNLANWEKNVVKLIHKMQVLQKQRRPLVVNFLTSFRILPSCSSLFQLFDL